MSCNKFDNILENAPQIEHFSNGQTVALKHNRLGCEIGGIGKSFALGNVFDEGSNILGSDKFIEVYFRTRSKNIYRLDEFGCLINSNESRRRGHVVATELPSSELEKRALDVGKPFVYERGGITTELEEIVAATGKYYGPGSDDLRELTGGKYNSIVDEFEKRMPPDLNDYSRIPG